MKATENENKAEKYAIITGASQGLGKAFAFELAKDKYNLILVSLPGEDLNRLAKAITGQQNVKVEFFETDLSETQNLIEFTTWVNKNFQVEILINNAGIGGTRAFGDVNTRYINNILQLNMVAPSILIHQLLPNLKQNPKAYILNVSSMAAFTPIGFKTVYPASKTFLHNFSLGLAEELKTTNISVSVVNPGAMKTNANVTRRIEEQGFMGRLTLLSPPKVARHCIDRMKRGNRIIVVNPVGYSVMKIIPKWIATRLITRTVRRELELSI